tara:strand:+ start:1000 stop:1239 length:240 start_codon:yes stop_codon:yes gene_type:complete
MWLLIIKILLTILWVSIALFLIIWLCWRMINVPLGGDNNILENLKKMERQDIMDERNETYNDGVCEGEYKHPDERNKIK